VNRAERTARLMGGAVSAGTWQRCRCPVCGGNSLLLREVDERMASKCTTGCDVDAVARGIRNAIMAKRPSQPDWVREAAIDERERRGAREAWYPAETEEEVVAEWEEQLAREAEEEQRLRDDPAVYNAADPAAAVYEIKQRLQRQRADAAAGHLSTEQIRELYEIAPTPDADRKPSERCSVCLEYIRISGSRAFAGLLHDGEVVRVGRCCLPHLVHVVIFEDLAAGNWTWDETREKPRRQP
jgi:hypothetical protein